MWIAVSSSFTVNLCISLVKCVIFNNEVMYTVKSKTVFFYGKKTAAVVARTLQSKIR